MDTSFSNNVLLQSLIFRIKNDWMLREYSNGMNIPKFIDSIESLYEKFQFDISTKINMTTEQLKIYIEKVCFPFLVDIEKIDDTFHIKFIDKLDEPISVRGMEKKI
jgi:hypothetical protein